VRPRPCCRQSKDRHSTGQRAQRKEHRLPSCSGGKTRLNRRAERWKQCEGATGAAAQRPSLPGLRHDAPEEGLATEYSENLGTEVLGDPAFGMLRKQPGERPTARGISDDLCPGGGVDDYRRQLLASSLSSRTASAAPTLSSSGPGPLKISSRRSRNAAGEPSSSGLVSTTAGTLGRSDGDRAIVTRLPQPPVSWLGRRRSSQGCFSLALSLLHAI
jgi:hypothetical protein